MTKTPYQSVWEFHTAMSQPRYLFPSLPGTARRELRKELLREEYSEYQEGEDENNLVKIADALADMTYIIYGTGIEYGLPMDAIFNEVHRSNMSKLDPDTGKPVYREDGKIMKPPSYSKPDLAAIIAAYQSDARVGRDDITDCYDPACADASAPGWCEGDHQDTADHSDHDDTDDHSDYGDQDGRQDDECMAPIPYAPNERFVVEVSIGDLMYAKADEHFEKTKTSFLAEARDNGDKSHFHFLAVRGDSQMYRL